MKLSYNQKARIVKYVLPVIVIVPFAFAGYNATHQTHAQSIISGKIGITTDKQTYHTGQMVNVTLSNATNVDLYVTNDCPSEPLIVDKQIDGKWTRIHDVTASTKCQGEPASYKIPSNASIKTDYRYWPGLFAQPGEYRITFKDKDFDASAYAVFTVEK